MAAITAGTARMATTRMFIRRVLLILHPAVTRRPRRRDEIAGG